MEKTWKTSYGNSDCPQQMIAEIVLEYFNELGAKILKAREDGVKLLSLVDFNPSYVYNMRRIGMSTTLLSGQSGGSKQVKELFGKDNMGCYAQIEKIYLTLCEECKGTMEYIDLEHDMITQVRFAESKMDTDIPEENNITFRDLYTLMQFAKRDQYGYYVISEGDAEIEDMALHIYSNKRQVNVCLKNMHGAWESLMNFVFVPEDNIVKIHIVDDHGVADYQNYYKHNINDELEPLETDGLVAYTGEPGDNTLDNIAFNYIRSILMLAIESQE